MFLKIIIESKVGVLECNYFRLVFLTVHRRVLVRPEVIPGAPQDAGGAEGGAKRG